MQTEQFHVILNTQFPCLPTPALTPRPSTTNFLQEDTQSSTLLRSGCPNHLYLPRLTTSATRLIPRRLHKSSLRFLSLKDTPHIHLTIICSVLSKLLRSAAFHCPGFSSIYQNTLDTSTIDPSFDTIRCTTHSQNRRKLLELSPSTSHSSSSRFHYKVYKIYSFLCRYWIYFNGIVYIVCLNQIQSLNVNFIYVFTCFSRQMGLCEAVMIINSNWESKILSWNYSCCHSIQHSCWIFCDVISGLKSFPPSSRFKRLMMSRLGYLTQLFITIDCS